MRGWWVLPLVVAGCRKPHQVVLEASADPHPPGCVFRVVANSSRGPIEDARVDGPKWTRAIGSDEGESWAVTATVSAATPDPACDVGVGCRVLVDGVEKKGESGARRVLCSWTVR